MSCGTVSRTASETIYLIERIDYCEIMESYARAALFWRRGARRKWFGFNVNICQILLRIIRNGVNEGGFSADEILLFGESGPIYSVDCASQRSR